MEALDIAGWVTAASTLGLLAATGVLAVFTHRLASASSQPEVIATLDVNRWGMMWMDLSLQNVGTGTAFEIKVAFDPPLPRFERRPKQPLQEVSVLRPGQSISTSQCEAKDALASAYVATISWKRRPKSRKRESIEYTIDLAGIADLSRLGAESPEVQIAEQIKKLREDWRPVATGSKRTRVEIYTNEDREAER